MIKYRYLVEALITIDDVCYVDEYWYSFREDIENDFKYGDLQKYSHICINDYGENFEKVEMPKTNMIYRTERN